MGAMERRVSGMGTNGLFGIASHERISGLLGALKRWPLGRMEVYQPIFYPSDRILVGSNPKLFCVSRILMPGRGIIRRSSPMLQINHLGTNKEIPHCEFK